MDSYYHFVSPNASLISLGRSEAVWQKISVSLPGYLGGVWEKLCREYVSGREIDGIYYGLASRWWGNVAVKEEKRNVAMEFDVVAKSLDGKHLLVGECKWTEGEYGECFLEELREKTSCAPFVIEDMTIHYALFTKTKLLDSPACLVFYPDDIVLAD
ncbi:DUF234 domain-containing protein [Lepagella muris]|uniref:DUF234 domain-containing protein n=1 Tax=Lepagella muris TaxID=3032870 RepID=UPI0023B80115|nr:DUF234 domain-containing protein [Lepagella muris]